MTQEYVSLFFSCDIKPDFVNILQYVYFDRLGLQSMKILLDLL